MLPVNVTGPWYSNSGLQVIHELSLLLQRPKRFLGLLIAGITALIAVIASVAASATALTQSIHTTTFVNNLATNVSNALGTQESIDRKLESHVNALEEVAIILGDQLAALKTAFSMHCHAEFSAICVTSKPYNHSQWPWPQIKNHLLGIWSHSSLFLDIVRLHEDITNIQHAAPLDVNPVEIALDIFTQITRTFAPSSLITLLYNCYWYFNIIVYLLFSSPPANWLTSNCRTPSRTLPPNIKK